MGRASIRYERRGVTSELERAVGRERGGATKEVEVEFFFSCSLHSTLNYSLFPFFFFPTRFQSSALFLIPMVRWTPSTGPPGLSPCARLSREAHREVARLRRLRSRPMNCLRRPPPPLAIQAFLASLALSLLALSTLRALSLRRPQGELYHFPEPTVRSVDPSSDAACALL